MRTLIAVLLFLGGSALFTFGMMVAIEGDGDIALLALVMNGIGGFMFGAGGWTLFMRRRPR